MIKKLFYIFILLSTKSILFSADQQQRLVSFSRKLIAGDILEIKVDGQENLKKVKILYFSSTDSLRERERVEAFYKKSPHHEVIYHPMMNNELIYCTTQP